MIGNICVTCCCVDWLTLAYSESSVLLWKNATLCQWKAFRTDATDLEICVSGGRVRANVGKSSLFEVSSCVQNCSWIFRFLFPPQSTAKERKENGEYKNIRKGIQEDKLPFEIAADLTRVAPKGAAKDLLMYSKCFLPTVWWLVWSQANLYTAAPPLSPDDDDDLKAFPSPVASYIYCTLLNVRKARKAFDVGVPMKNVKVATLGAFQIIDKILDKHKVQKKKE